MRSHRATGPLVISAVSINTGVQSTVISSSALSGVADNQLLIALVHLHNAFAADELGLQLMFSDADAPGTTRLLDPEQQAAVTTP